ncbi:TonB-dependent receptor plug domain-containing protein [Vaginella massiliensis]|uniref:TonB-dependent receptor plug domain-containing protein n=1 Tax=Vaginella massiliensis TaxID=1816680 RepID=UPI0037512F0C
MRILFWMITAFGCTPALAQTQDSIVLDTDRIELEQTVVSGQYSKQSVKKSIYEVKVLNRDVLERLAANNLADVLNQTLNLTVINNPSTGKSSMSMFGMGGQYFKVLVDNIPLLNDESLGNHTDLTQLSLEDIEQIEIVEGAMGVDYGANALAGIINIITKKRGRAKVDISAYIQEETINNEYNLKNKGRHIQSLKIGHGINPKWYTEFNFNHNDFKGFWDKKLGKHHAENDGKRGYSWLPKTQNSSKFLMRHFTSTHQFFYRLEYFDEKTNYYNPIVQLNEQPSTATNNALSEDTQFNTRRLYNLFNANGSFSDAWQYDFSLSYQNQKRKQKNYQYYIASQIEDNVRTSIYDSREAFYSKATMSNIVRDSKFNFQFGYEINSIFGKAAQRKDIYVEPIDRQVNSYDFFVSSEVNFTPKFSVRPGYRAMFSNLFQTQHAASLSAKLMLPQDFEFRVIAGTAPRNPDYDELFTYFVDVNHDLQGNPDLKPESGNSVFLHLKKNWYKEHSSYVQKLSAWKIHLHDKIELMAVSLSPLKYKYINVDQYDTQGLTYSSDWNYKSFQLSAGLSVTGIKQSLAEEANVDEKYFYTTNFNISASYLIPSIETTFSVFYKFNGKQELYREDGQLGSQVSYVKGIQGAYSWMDASIRQKFFDKKLELVLGARNLFDVTTITNTTQAASGHAAASSSIMLGYGRSYFLKILYNLKFN